MNESCGLTNRYSGQSLPRCFSRRGCRQCWSKYHHAHKHRGLAVECGLCGGRPPRPEPVAPTYDFDLV